MALGLASVGSVFPGPEACGQALCLERGTPLDFVAHWHQRFNPNNKSDDDSELSTTTATMTNEEKFDAWFLPTCQAAELGFVSYHPNPINMFWVQPETKEHVPQARQEAHVTHT